MLLSTEQDYIKLNGIKLPGAIQQISINGEIVTSSNNNNIKTIQSYKDKKVSFI